MNQIKKVSFNSNHHHQVNINEQLVFNTNNNNISDDDSEEPTRSSSANSYNNKDVEGKNQQKWKRKISRKQFRHHNIKIFNPKECPSHSLLKPDLNNSNNAIINNNNKKQENSSNEIINTERIIKNFNVKINNNNNNQNKDLLEHSKKNNGILFIEENNNNNNTEETHKQNNQLLLNNEYLKMETSSSSLKVQQNNLLLNNNNNNNRINLENVEKKSHPNIKILSDMPLLDHHQITPSSSSRPWENFQQELKTNFPEVPVDLRKNHQQQQQQENIKTMSKSSKKIKYPPNFIPEMLIQHQHYLIVNKQAEIQQWMKTLQQLLQLHFTIPLLEQISYVYQQLGLVKDDPYCINEEIKFNANRLYLETFTFISNKIRYEFGMNVNNVQDVIRILGQIQLDSVKESLRFKLEHILRMRNLNAMNGQQFLANSQIPQHRNNSSLMSFNNKETAELPVEMRPVLSYPQVDYNNIIDHQQKLMKKPQKMHIRKYPTNVAPKPKITPQQERFNHHPNNSVQQNLHFFPNYIPHPYLRPNNNEIKLSLNDKFSPKTFKDDKITSTTTDTVEITKIIPSVKIELKLNNNNNNGPRVVIEDNSNMQITKETKKITEPDVQTNNIRRESVIILSKNKSSSSNSVSDEENNNMELKKWLDKLNKNKVLKNKFLRKMGIINQPIISEKDLVEEYIEIFDSDEENNDDENKKAVPSSSETQEINISGLISAKTENAGEAVPSESQIKPETLSKIELLSPQMKNEIYSPQIEPISPTLPSENEEIFRFPPPVTGTGSSATNSVVSPSGFPSKRKTPDFSNDDNNEKSTIIIKATDTEEKKRRKSLERPQISLSPREGPLGKLSYIRENSIFLRYFDDTQKELFILSLSSQDDEDENLNSKKTGIIEPQKSDYFAKTEVIHLPKNIEFSAKEDLPDVEEFVKESNLVENYVPKDFADFYRYVTGFQIIKKKHPVSLKTFLTMYNTNRTGELLKKYLQRRDEDPIN